MVDRDLRYSLSSLAPLFLRCLFVFVFAALASGKQQQQQQRTGKMQATANNNNETIRLQISDLILFSHLIVSFSLHIDYYDARQKTTVCRYRCIYFDSDDAQCRQSGIQIEKICVRVYVAVHP